ncbi:hypothetical protein J5N97_019688 [Dioscorea zingiberensis]|uniref:Uncharacterized protein n=1 Tax=Dioscorea zingiberensis TaxID=325984 RepID=A0A9D5CF61_9LILI|nr:hypothetical protein J5N97_019688 [Dioscorea zingiberensis]
MEGSHTASNPMAEVPLINDAIARAEKKLDMSLDDLIKMSKKTSSAKRKPHRVPIKSQGIFGSNTSQRNIKHRQFMDSRSSIRQGVLAKRRSNCQGNQFPLTTEVAKKAASVPIHDRMVNWNKRRFTSAPAEKKATESSQHGKDNVMPKQKPQTLDALFASMKEQRMRVLSRRRQGQWQIRGPGGAQPVSSGHQSGKFAR